MTTSPHDKPPTDETFRDSDVLDQCLQAIRRNEATIEDCVHLHPEFAELGTLLRSALAMQQMPHVELRAQSRSELRQRVLAHYDVQATKKPVRSPGRNLRSWLRPAIAFITIVIIFFAGSVSVLHAATLSVPGDTLYGLKRVTERIQLALAADDQARIGTLESIASTRLDEVAVLVARNASITGPVLNDVSASIDAALNAEPNASTRQSIINKAGNVLDQAQKAGAIDPTTEASVMVTIRNASPDKNDVPPQATAVYTPTWTATPSTTPTMMPTDPPALEPTDAAKAPKPTKQHPVKPTHRPNGPPQKPPIAATNSANNNGNGNGNGDGNGNGHGNH